jgi:hypothetical protein
MMPTAKSLSPPPPPPPPPPPATHPLDIIDTDLYDVDAKRDFSGSLTFLLLLVLWNGMYRAEESCVAFNAISVKLFATTIPFGASSSQFATVKLPLSCSSSLPPGLISSAILLTSSPETPHFQQNKSPYRRRRRRSILGASSFSSFFSS